MWTPRRFFLIGENPDDHYRPLVYVGESDDVATRLTQHNRLDEKGGKDFWKKVCLITSKDQNLTKSHIKFLESELLTLARQACACILQNETNPTYEHLPESDVADMKFFIQQFRTILPVLGFNFLEDARRTSSEPASLLQQEGTSFVLNLPRSTKVAHATEIAGEMIVKKGSNVRDKWVGSLKSTYGGLYHHLIDTGFITTDSQGDRQFAEDYAFSSPSAAAAAAVVTGRTSNGRVEWKVVETQQTYAQWADSQLENVIAAG